MEKKKKLCKVDKDKKLCGVCTGFAKYLDVDVTLIRILFVILTLFWGGGLILYLACTFIMPDDEMWQ